MSLGVVASALKIGKYADTDPNTWLGVTRQEGDVKLQGGYKLSIDCTHSLVTFNEVLLRFRFYAYISSLICHVHSGCHCLASFSS